MSTCVADVKTDIVGDPYQCKIRSYKSIFNSLRENQFVYMYCRLNFDDVCLFNEMHSIRDTDFGWGKSSINQIHP